MPGSAVRRVTSDRLAGEAEGSGLGQFIWCWQTRTKLDKRLVTTCTAAPYGQLVKWSQAIFITRLEEFYPTH